MGPLVAASQDMTTREIETLVRGTLADMGESAQGLRFGAGPLPDSVTVDCTENITGARVLFFTTTMTRTLGTEGLWAACSLRIDPYGQTILIKNYRAQ